MNEITIEQKQELYEHLLTLDCPDLLAAAIAAKSDNLYSDLIAETTLSTILRKSFDWKTTKEDDLWVDVYLCFEDFEKGSYTLNEDGVYVLPEVVETTDVTDEYQLLKLDPEYRLPLQTLPEAPSMQQPLDYEIKGGEVFGYVSKEEPELTFWQRIKFYAGRLFYKV